MNWFNSQGQGRGGRDIALLTSKRNDLYDFINVIILLNIRIIVNFEPKGVVFQWCTIPLIGLMWRDWLHWERKQKWMNATSHECWFLNTLITYSLSLFLFLFISLSLSIYLSIYLPIYLSIYPIFYLWGRNSYLLVLFSFYDAEFFFSPFIYLFIYLYIYLSLYIYHLTRRGAR